MCFGGFYTVRHEHTVQISENWDLIFSETDALILKNNFTKAQLPILFVCKQKSN